MDEKPDHLMGDHASEACLRVDCLARAADADEIRVLHRLRWRAASQIVATPDTRLALIVDVETTGMRPGPCALPSTGAKSDAPADEIIEICALPVTYRPQDGMVIATHPCFTALRQPLRPIPASITALTGLDEAAVAGREITRAQFLDAIDPSWVAVVLAHNARFDRRFLEAYEPLADLFINMPWACTIEDAAWAEEGVGSNKLEYIAMTAFRTFYDAHRAEDDCRVVAELLARTMPRSGGTVLAKVLASARRARWRVRAVGAPYEARETLKARNYRWDAGTPTRTKSWFVDVQTEEAVADELAFVAATRSRAPCEVVRLDALTRFSDRI